MVAQFKTEYWLNSSGQVAQSGADYSVEGCKECEEIKIYPHLFRRTFVTRCYEAGVDPMTIALIVGHSREKMVNHYTHISKEFQKKDFVKYEEQEKERILSDSE